MTPQIPMLLQDLNTIQGKNNIKNQTVFIDLLVSTVYQMSIQVFPYGIKAGIISPQILKMYNSHPTIVNSRPNEWLQDDRSKQRLAICDRNQTRLHYEEDVIKELKYHIA